MIVTILTNDGILNPCGGLGVYLRETLSRMPSGIRFLVIGPTTDPMHRGSNYAYVHLNNTAGIREAASMLERTTVIHAMDAHNFEAAMRLKAKLRKPFIAHVHLSERLLAEDLSRASDSATNWDPKRMAQAELAGLAAADHIIHVSHNYARRFPPAKVPVSVVWNGIDAAAIRRPAAHFGLPGPQGNRKLLYIGRFTRQKGLQNLLRTRLPAGVNLYLVGGSGAGSDADLTMEVIRWTAANPNAFYLGNIWDDRKRSILQQCDGLLVPSIHEPFGIVGLEGIAAGCLVISSFADGLADYLKPEYAIPCGFTPAGIQAALNRFASMPAAEIRDMTTQASRILPHFTWEAAVARLVPIYQSFQTIPNPYRHVQPSPQPLPFR